MGFADNADRAAIARARQQSLASTTSASLLQLQTVASSILLRLGNEAAVYLASKRVPTEPVGHVKQGRFGGPKFQVTGGEWQLDTSDWRGNNGELCVSPDGAITFRKRIGVHEYSRSDPYNREYKLGPGVALTGGMFEAQPQGNYAEAAMPGNASRDVEVKLRISSDHRLTISIGKREQLFADYLAGCAGSLAARFR